MNGLKDAELQIDSSQDIRLTCLEMTYRIGHAGDIVPMNV